MNFNNFFTYNENKELHFSLPTKTFITIMGEGKNRLLKNLLFEKKHEYISLMFTKITAKNILNYKKNVMFILHKHLNIFIGETVNDEIAFGMESLGINRSEMKNTIENYAKSFNIIHLLNKDPNCIGTSDKAKVKLISALVCKPKVLILDEILCEIDKYEIKIVLNNLKKFVEEENIIMNFTNDVNETLYGDEILVLNDEKILISGKTLNVLNEDKIMKKLGLGLPFVIELNKYLIDYEIINKYQLDIERLVDEIWK